MKLHNEDIVGFEDYLTPNELEHLKSLKSNHYISEAIISYMRKYKIERVVFTHTKTYEATR